MRLKDHEKTINVISSFGGFGRCPGCLRSKSRDAKTGPGYPGPDRYVEPVGFAIRVADRVTGQAGVVT